MVWCGHLDVLPPGLRFVYIILFNVLKNTNLEFHNEIQSILPKIREAYVSKSNSNLMTICEGCSNVRVRYKTKSANKWKGIVLQVYQVWHYLSAKKQGWASIFWIQNQIKLLMVSLQLVASWGLKFNSQSWYVTKYGNYDVPQLLPWLVLINITVNVICGIVSTCWQLFQHALSHT